MDVQLRKGLLELCVLATLQRSDSYGYKMLKDISKYIDISESTLYPILRRLESANKVTSFNEEHNNRIRKIFHLTDIGVETLQAFRHEKKQLISVLDYITAENKGENKI